MANIRHLTDSAGEVTDSYTYSAYGELLSQTGTTENRYRYSGKVGCYTDSLGFDNVLCGVRWYSPKLKRWLQRDSISYSGGLNLYEYAASNPVMYVDASGENPVVVVVGGILVLLDMLSPTEFEQSELDRALQSLEEIGGGLISGGGGKLVKACAKNITRSTRKRLKRLIRNISRNELKGGGLNQEQYDKLKKLIEKFGGQVRHDGTSGVRGSSAGTNHAGLENMGRLNGKHIWLQPGVK